MKLVIISGRSGSGKSTALHLLEDEGYHCIDNMPASLIPELVRFLQQSPSPEHDKVALSIDARNAIKNLSGFAESLRHKPEALELEVIYLDANDQALIKRFSETRRRHPLSSRNTALAEAIQSEKTLLEPIANIASLTIDTSNMTLHELRSEIKNRLVQRQGSGLSILFQSFGFKRGLPSDADFAFDVRVLPNPHWDPQLRSLTGRDQPVIDFLDQQPEVDEMYNDIRAYLEKWLPHFESNNRSYVTIAIGCTGGQHRSVYMAERLARHFATRYTNVQFRNREIN